MILNISPDHLERHKTIKNYVSAKFKLIENQKKNSIAFINKYDRYLNERLNKKSYKNKIVKIDTKLDKKNTNIFQNDISYQHQIKKIYHL